MARLGLVTLELMLAELRRPVFAGDLPIKMDPGMARYESVQSGEEYAGGYIGGAGPDEEDCGCGGDGCGDGGCGDGCGSGGCGSEMSMDERPAIDAGPMAGPADFAFYGSDPVGDRDRTRDRSPRPERKRLPWSFAPRAAMAS